MVKQQPVMQSQGTNVWAIIGFIFSFIFPVFGLIFSIVALVQLKKNPNQKGHGLALAGVIISTVLLVLIILFLIVALSMLSSLGYTA